MPKGRRIENPDEKRLLCSSHCPGSRGLPKQKARPRYEIGLCFFADREGAQLTATNGDQKCL